MDLLVAMQSTNRHQCWQSKFNAPQTFLVIFITLICISPLIGLGQQQAAHHNGQPAGNHGLGGGGHNHHHHMMQEPPAAPRVDPYQNIKILIPNLPPAHYQFWLKNHPRAAKVFEDVCSQAGSRVADIKDLAQFHLLHANLSFEQPRYLHDLDYGKSVLSLICSKIRDVNKSCWGYENNCQEIHLMPECRGTSHGEAKSEQEQKIKWFSQADFGYILERRKEMSKYCAPDKKANPSEVSSLECTKHFTTCRGTNLYVQFNTSNLVQKGLGLSSLVGSGVAELGGWSCDLQTLRIKEEAGRTGKHQSWYNELASYKLVDALKPQESHDLLVDKQVFFVKVDSSSGNLDDYLATLINLYATIHLNNRFSDDIQIMLWGDKIPRPRSHDQLWYAFSRNPPMSIGQFNGKRILFKKFIFAMPPKMVDGLHTDKQLIGGCAKSGLYNAFQKHIIHRLNTPQLYDLNFHKKTQGRLLRVAILSRTNSEFREIINEKELEEAIKGHSKGNVFVQILKYNSMDFGHVLLSVLNSDIVIGLHGQGLAYSLFLPDWAALIELYDCKKNRYHNLARLRGIGYYKPTDEQLRTADGFVKKIQVPEDSSLWQRYNRSQLVDNDEFNNYEVNVDQFMQLYLRASEKVFKSRNEHFSKLEVQQAEMIAVQPPAAAASPAQSPESVEKQKKPEQAQTTNSPTTTTSTTTTTTSTTTTAAPSTASSEAPKAQAKVKTEPHLANVINAKGQKKPSATHNEL